MTSTIRLRVFFFLILSLYNVQLGGPLSQGPLTVNTVAATIPSNLSRRISRAGTPSKAVMLPSLNPR